uniref:Uncharacterized protein n=1 Tax=Setaria digitata TaxID=48799 RepID=A0A915PZD0_9BILA
MNLFIVGFYIIFENTGKEAPKNLPHKTLKERTSECDSLKKKLEKFERDRQQWENQKRALEAKQPMDVQMLQGQKRELTMQLDREQAEKQELFLQINSLIAQLADANRDTSDLRELKDENTMLKNQIIDIQAIQKQLNADVQNLQEEIRRKNQEVESAQEESKKLRSTIENEKIQLESSIGELQRDLQIKSAALQSLMLAKQANSALINRLTVENEDLREQIDEIKNEVKKRVSEIEDVKSENEKEIAKLRSELNSVLEDVKKREAELAAMQDKEVYETSQLRETLDRSKLDMEKINKQLEESQKNLAECEQKYEAMKKDSETKLSLEKEILADVNKKYEEEIRQQEMRFNNLKQSLRMQEMRTDEAEQEAKNNRMKITDLEKELKMLRMQTDKQRTVDEQLRLLREELKEAKHQIAAQAADLEKAEIDADEAERSTRETIDELEEEVHFLQEKVKILEVSKEEQCSRLSIAEKELKEHRETSEKYEKKCEALTKSLEELRTALTDSHITLEKFKIENEKLMAKASLEDEVLTLATSLQSARDEISVKHDEIAKLRKELRELHDRNERLLMDFEIQTQALQQDAQSARAECDEVRKEMEKCKSNNSIQQERDSLLLTKLRNEISNLEEQIIEKEKVFSSVRNDLELKHQKMLIETKQQYEQKITELREEVEQLRASESEKIDELNIVMSNLRKELAVKSGSFASSRTGLYQEFENQKERSVDLSPRSDFEEKLASLKECIADVLEEKLLFEQGDFQPILINKATQTMLKVEDGRHIISVNDDDEESLGPRDKNILLPRREISNFNRSYVNKSYNTDSEQIWRSKSSSEVWNLRAELAFLKKQIADDEMSKKRLQKHIQMLETTLHGKEGVLDLMKETKKDVKSDNHNNLRESLSPVTEQVEKLKTELQNALECSERCRRELQERDLDVASLKKDNEKLTNEIRSYKMRLNESIDVEDRNRVLEYENRNLLDDNSLLKVKLTKLRDQFAEAENKSLQRHMEEVTNLNQQLDKARQAYELSGAEMSRLQEQSANLSKEVNHLRNFLNIANTEKEQLKAEACEHRKELDRLSGERMELEVTRQQLNEAIAEGEHQAQEIARLKAQTEGDESLEKDRQQELHTLRQEIVTVEEKWKMKYKKSEANVEAAKKDLQKLTETNDTLIENIKRLSNELDLERKKVIDLGAEGTRLLDEVEKLRNELDMLRRQEENSPDMKKKLSELMAENAQLAGELLKKHSLVNRKSSKEDQEMEEPLEKHDECWKCKGKSSEEEIREELKSVMEDSEKRLQQCNEKWAVKLKNQAEILEREMAEVRAENEELRSQNERMRSEISEIELEKKKSKQLSEKLNDTEERLKELESNLSRLKAANNTPTPPPRKRSENEATADGLSQVSLTDENKKLKKDIEISMLAFCFVQIF